MRYTLRQPSPRRCRPQSRVSSPLLRVDARNFIAGMSSSLGALVEEFKNLQIAKVGFVSLLPHYHDLDLREWDSSVCYR